MTTYAVTFSTAGAYAEHLITAATPQQALTKGRQMAGNKRWKPDFQDYEDSARIEHIAIRSADGEPLCEWCSDDLQLRLAAGDLLDALQTQTEAAQEVVDAWAKGDLAAAVRMLDASLPAARAAISYAKGGAL